MLSCIGLLFNCFIHYFGYGILAEVIGSTRKNYAVSWWLFVFNIFWTCIFVFNWSEY